MRSSSSCSSGSSGTGGIGRFWRTTLKRPFLYDCERWRSKSSLVGFRPKDDTVISIDLSDSSESGSKNSIPVFLTRLITKRFEYAAGCEMGHRKCSVERETGFVSRPEGNMPSESAWGQFKKFAVSCQINFTAQKFRQMVQLFCVSLGWPYKNSYLFCARF